MRPKLAKLEAQVVVITGATSGIGLATAREAARRGAHVVLVARNEEDLARIAAEIRAQGGTALAVGCDVSDASAVEHVCDTALSRFGRIDTWINNAGVSIYEALLEVDLVESKRLFDVNFWGTVHGCRAAVSAMRDQGGAIINIGSALSDRVMPLQGMYSASKHAVKAYTDGLRMEVEMENIPISVTLVKPSSIDTPHPEHARNHLDVSPTHTPPVYAAELVAHTILYCAEHPKRDVTVGGSGKLFSVLETLAPRLTDKLMERTMGRIQRSNRPRLPEDSDSLFIEPLIEGETHGAYEGPVLRRSLYTTLSLHPVASLLGVVGAALVVGAVRMR